MTKFYITLMFFLMVFVGHAQESILGFTPDNSKKEQELEASFDAKLSTVHLDSAMPHLTAQPNFTGSEYEHENAEWILKQFKDCGSMMLILNRTRYFSLSKNKFIRAHRPHNL